MRELDYAGSAFLLSDRLAEALLEYAKSLAAHGKADTIRLDAYDQASEPVEIQVLLGPASQIVTRAVEARLPEPEDDARTVEDLERRIARLRPSRPVPQPLEEEDLDML